MNGLTVRALQRAVVPLHAARAGAAIVHPETFFYPLDVVRDWNRLYGRRGFTQYQCVLPIERDRARRAPLLRGA